MKEAADKKKYKVPFWKTVKKHWMLLAMLAPAVIYVVIFAYIPMTGVVLAFKNYQYAGGIYGSPWNGLDNFKALLVAGKLGQVTRNTLLYNIAFLFLGVVFEMGSAILLNEIFGNAQTEPAFMNNTVRTYLRTSKNSCRKFQIPVHTSMFCSCSPVLNGSSLSVARSARSEVVGRFAFGCGNFSSLAGYSNGTAKRNGMEFLQCILCPERQ